MIKPLFLRSSLIYSAQEARSVALARLSDLSRELDSQEPELNAYGDSNPAKVDELKRAVFLAKEAALRWTGSFTI